MATNELKRKFTEEPAVSSILTGKEIILLHDGKGVKNVSLSTLMEEAGGEEVVTPYGRNLATIFADEIAEYSDPWAWVQGRVNTENFSSLRVNDYIQFTTTEGYTFDAQLMGQAYSEHYGDTAIGPHLDFCTRQVYPTTHVWNAANSNNGNANNANPFMASELYTWMQGTLYATLPAELKAVIGTKRLWAESRYSASGALTDSTGHVWISEGPLWLPTEIEVRATNNWGTKGFHEGEYQYPYFRYAENKSKLDVNGARRNWWVAASQSGYSTNLCALGAYGILGFASASDTYLVVPFCFRIVKKSA